MIQVAHTEALVESLCGDLSHVRAPRGTDLIARSRQITAVESVVSRLD